MRLAISMSISCALFAAAAAAGARAETAPPLPPGQYVWVLDRMSCEPGLRPQPNGPYAALVFCENALGAYLAVVRLAPLAKSVEGAWNVRQLIWQEAPWASDITSFAWAPDGERLFVTTAAEAGSGGVYELELRSRRSRQVAPPDSTVTAERPGPGYVIERLDGGRGVLHYRAIPWGLRPGQTERDSLVLGRGE